MSFFVKRKICIYLDVVVFRLLYSKYAYSMQYVLYVIIMLFIKLHETTI